MGFLKQLMIRVGADVSGVDKELKKAQKQIESFGKNVGKVGDTLTKAITLPIVAVGGAAIKLGLDAVETEQKFSYAFGGMEKSVRDWSNAYSKARGLNAYEVRSTAASFMTMAKGFGVSGTEAGKMAQDLTDAAESLAEVYEVDSSTMVDNFMSAMKGRANALKEYGVVIDDATQKSYAYSHGIAAVGEDLNSPQKILANYGIIMASAKDEMTEFGNTGKDLASTIKNKLTTALTDFGTTLVKTGAFDRIVTALMKILDGAAQLVDTFAKLPPGVQDTIVTVGLFAAALGPVLSLTGKLVTTVLDIKKAWDAAAAAFAAYSKVAGAGAAGAGAASKGLVPYAGAAASSTGLANTVGAGAAAVVVGHSMDAAAREQAMRMESDRLARIAAKESASSFDGLTKATETLRAHFNRFMEEAMPSSTAAQGVAGAYNTDKRGLPDPKIVDDSAAVEEWARKLDTFRTKVLSLAEAMESAARSFANFIGMFDRTERQQYSGNRLANRMEGQMRQMQDWVSAMGELKGKVSGGLYKDLLNMGPGAVDQIRALLNDGDAMSRYEAAYTERNRLAAGMGQESAWANYKAQTNIESQVNNITVVTNDEEKIKAIVVKTLRLAGAR